MPLPQPARSTSGGSRPSATLRIRLPAAGHRRSAGAQLQHSWCPRQGAGRWQTHEREEHLQRTAVSSCTSQPQRARAAPCVARTLAKNSQMAAMKYLLHRACPQQAARRLWAVARWAGRQAVAGRPSWGLTSCHSGLAGSAEGLHPPAHRQSPSKKAQSSQSSGKTVNPARVVRTRPPSRCPAPDLCSPGPVIRWPGQPTNAGQAVT